MKKIISIVCIMVLMPWAGVAQQFYSPNQLLLKEALTPALVLVEQSFHLQDTATQQRFGRNNQPEFGRGVALGVRCDKGLVVGDRLQRPWLYDSTCASYLGRYRGVATTVTLRQLSDSVAAVRHSFDTMQRCELTKEVNYLWNDSTTLCNTMVVAPIDSITANGWLLWVTSPKKMSEADSTTKVNYSIYRHQVLPHDDSLHYRVAAPASNFQVWGGIYVYPRIPAPGHIELQLVGCLYPLQDAWVMVPFVKQQTAPTSVSTATPSDEEAEEANSQELTPIATDNDGQSASKRNNIIKRNKKNRKNGND